MRETQQMRAQGSNSSNSNAALSQQQQRQQDIICEHRFVESVLDLHDRFKSITLDCFRAQPRISQDTFGSSTRPAPQADSLFQKALKEGPYCVLATTRSSQYGVPVFPERHIIVGLFPCMRFPGAFIAFSLTVSAFESFVNAQSLQPPFAQLLASFCDRILRKAGGTAYYVMLHMWRIVVKQIQCFSATDGMNSYSRRLLYSRRTHMGPFPFARHDAYPYLAWSVE